MAPMATPRLSSIRLTWWMPSGPMISTGIEEGRADQHRRHADEAVEGGDQLRHGGHLDRRAMTSRRCRRSASRRYLQRSDVVSSPASTTAMARPSMPARLRAGWWSARQAAQGDDEADAGDEIGKKDPGRDRGGLMHRAAPSSCTSPACVGDREAAEDVHRASATAIRPSHFEPGLSAAAAAISAPTTMTEEMALVTLISGVQRRRPGRRRNSRRSRPARKSTGSR